MSIAIIFPPQLRSLSGGRDQVKVSASTLAGAIAALEPECPGVSSRILGLDGKLRRSISVHINGCSARTMADDARKTAPKNPDGEAPYSDPLKLEIPDCSEIVILPRNPIETSPLR